jgi:hypothetical protein
LDIRIVVVLTLITVGLSNCENVSNDAIMGQWQAVQVEEEGEILPINAEEIKFNFQENEAYTYQSTLNYREAGSYYVENDYLYTTDTVNQGSMEKAVEILLMTADSLHLKMDEKGQERIIRLGKIN